MSKHKVKKEPLTEKYESLLEELNRKLDKARRTGDLDNTKRYIEEIKQLYKDWIEELKQTRKEKV